MALRGCEIALTDAFRALSKTNLQWTNEIKKLGGAVTHLITNRATHLVCAEPTGFQVEQAIESQLHIVTEEWLIRCVETQSRVDEKPFEHPVKQPSTRQVYDPSAPSGFGELSESGGESAGEQSDGSFPDDYEILRRDILQLTMFESNANKFYSLELHATPRGEYRIFSHYGRTGQQGTTLSRSFPSEATASAAYDKLKAQKEGKGYKKVELLSSNIGSAKARKQFSPAQESEEDDMSSQMLTPAVAQLVSSIYHEADAALQSAVSGKITAHGIETPLGVLTMSQVIEGEDILNQIGVCLQDAGGRDELKRLCGAFFTVIPHKIGVSAISDALIDTEKKFETWQESIQLMKDMLNVRNSFPSASLTKLDMRYSALNCSVTQLPAGSSEYMEVERHVKGSQVPEKNLDINIIGIFKLSRPVEEAQFDHVVGNEQLLFHGSRYSNFVGLLSRGLLMPKVIVGRGGTRTDAGNLGNGIYFGSASTTAAQYTQPSANNDRLLLVNRVALGKVKDYTERTVGLSAPPSGFDSVHGLASSPFRSSFFEDDEYVVFRPEQQKMQYLVRFTLNHDKTSVPAFPEQHFASQPSQTVPSWGSQDSSVAPVFSSSSASFSSASFSPSSSQFSPSSSQEASRGFAFGGAAPTPSFGSAAGGSRDMTAEQRALKEEEDEFRRRFATNRSDYRLQQDSMNFLLNVHEGLTFIAEPLSPEESAMAGVFRSMREELVPGNPSIRNCSLSMFNDSWADVSSGMFEGMDWSNVVAAGGSVLLALGASPATSNSSDIDLFLYGLTPSEANEKVKHIVDVVERNSGNGQAAIVRTQHALTIIGDYPRRHVQIILRLYMNPAEVLMGFDIDCCCVGYDGSKVLALKRARRAINRRYNLVDLSRRSLTYETRLFKYSKRGYAVLVPGADLTAVSPNVFTYCVSQLKGLAKLLLLEKQCDAGWKVVPASSSVKSAMAKKVRKVDKTDDASERLLEFEERDAEPSDYDNVMIPWGPQWSAGLILRYLQRDDQASFFAAKARDSTAHKHVFVAGVREVLSGTSCWCSECKRGSTPTDGVSGQIQWTTDDPGRQLLTGSFHPVTDDQWFADATRELPPATGNMVTWGDGFSKKKKTAAAPKKSFAKAVPKAAFQFSPVKSAATAPVKLSAKKMSEKMKKMPAKKVPSPFKKSVAAKKPAAKKPVAKMPVMTATAFPTKKQPALKKGSSKKTPKPAFSAPQPSFAPQFAFDAMPPDSGYDMVPPAAGGPFVGYGAGADDLRAAVERNAQQLQQWGQPAQPLSGRSLAAESASSVFSGTIPPQSYVSKLLLLIARMMKDQLITKEERAVLKDMVLTKNPMALSALEVFEVDNDYDELADTFKRIVAAQR